MRGLSCTLLVSISWRKPTIKSERLTGGRLGTALDSVGAYHARSVGWRQLWVVVIAELALLVNALLAPRVGFEHPVCFLVAKLACCSNHFCLACSSLPPHPVTSPILHVNAILAWRCVAPFASCNRGCCMQSTAVLQLVLLMVVLWLHTGTG